MPPRASKVCSFEGCHQLSGRDSRCPDHAKKWEGPRTASSKRTGTRRWKALRERVIQRDDCICQMRLPAARAQQAKSIM